MTRKGWCKTVQLVLDDLNNGCELIVYVYPDKWVRGTDPYLWHPERGETIRYVQAPHLRRLVHDGYVIEKSREVVAGGLLGYGSQGIQGGDTI